MPAVLVLTAAGDLGDDVIGAVRAALTGRVRLAAARRLAGNAVEMALSGGLDGVLDIARAALGDAPVDANAVTTRGRRKQLLICDMDSTIIPVECIDEIADFAGVKDRVAAITERAMLGELDFEAALRERVALLEGLSEATLQTVYDERVTLNPGASEMVQTMAAGGALTALVSGGFDFFTERVAAAAGFQHHQANRLLVADGRLTGLPGDPILGRAAKLEALQRLSASIDAGPLDAVAVGDGANDLAMIEAAGLGVAYRAKPAVAARSDAQLNHSDLSAVLRLQGIAAKGYS
ncbi:MAG: phosphoserine phosphatase SerB [Pseudomonadota bacterium]